MADSTWVSGGYNTTYRVTSPFVTGQAHLVGKASKRGEEVLQDGAFVVRRMQDSLKKMRGFREYVCFISSCC